MAEVPSELQAEILTVSMRDIAGKLLPLLFASGPGSELQRPLAIVVIGGLVSATALTLILLPMSYRWVSRRTTKGMAP